MLLYHDRDSKGAFHDTDFEDIDNYLLTYDLIAGVSNRFNDLSNIKANYEQAIIAINTAISIQKRGQVFDFQQQLIYDLILI